MVFIAYRGKSHITRVSLLRNIKGQTVGKHEITNTEKLISHSFGFLLRIKQRVEMEERLKKKTNIVTSFRMVHVAQSSGSGLKERLWI